MPAVVEKSLPNQMLSQIEQKRNELIHTGTKEGLKSHNTLQQSKELDKLILFYQRSTALK